MEDNDDNAQPSTSDPQQVFQPGVHDVPEGEELDYDRTAYDCLHKWALDWPCLSFDICRDSLGDSRSSFPHTAYMVAGTQAAPGQKNHLAVIKLSALTQGDHGKVCTTAGKLTHHVGRAGWPTAPLENPSVSLLVWRSCP
jgi:ribosome assembly protein RRB1